MACEEHKTYKEQKMEDRKREYEKLECARMECQMERTNFEEVDDASPASPSYRLSSSIVQTFETYSQRMQEEDKKEVEECTKSDGNNQTLEDGSMSLEKSLEDSPIILKTSSISNVYDTLSVSKTPFPDLSPASVLNPPGSSKRRKTITDYFGN
jgi:chromatin segregation and condensation protein Rec8/ScpA/Scc1 (kleisin family)